MCQGHRHGPRRTLKGRNSMYCQPNRATLQPQGLVDSAVGAHFLLPTTISLDDGYPLPTPSLPQTVHMDSGNSQKKYLDATDDSRISMYMAKTMTVAGGKRYQSYSTARLQRGTAREICASTIRAEDLGIDTVLAGSPAHAPSNHPWRTIQFTCPRVGSGDCGWVITEMEWCVHRPFSSLPLLMTVQVFVYH
jgi:hypothetical protein